MLLRLYRLFLHLFPARYRATFGREMAAVFQQAQAPARVRGGVSLTAFCIREFSGLLVAAFRERTWCPDSGKQALAANPPARAFDGVPCFYSCDEYLPRQSALFHGGVLSLVLFSAVSAAFEYGVSRHPLRLHLGASHDSGQFQTPTTITTNESGFVAFGRSMGASASSVLQMLLESGRTTATSERRPGRVKPASIWSKLRWLLSIRPQFRGEAALSAPSGFNPVTEVQRLPDTPAGHRFAQWLRLYNSGNADQLKRFYTENFENASAEPAGAETNAAVWAEMRGRFGAYELRSVEQSSPHALVVLCQTGKTGYWTRLRMQLSPQKPHRVVMFPYRSFGKDRPTAAETDLLQPEEQTTGQRPPAALPPGTRSMQLPLRLVESYAGVYESEGPDRFTALVTLKSGKLTIQVNGQEPTPLIAQSETKFFPNGVTNRWVEFVRSESAGLQLVITQGGREYRARRKQE